MVNRTMSAAGTTPNTSDPYIVIPFALIVEEILARWESVTNGNEGMRVKTLSLLGVTVPRDSPTFYFLCLAVLVLTIVGTLNLLRSPTGRAFVAIRDSETAARAWASTSPATK